ncbi:unnamed protein product, partial [Ectocarpus sp. 4 AP-2014]
PDQSSSPPLPPAAAAAPPPTARPPRGGAGGKARRRVQRRRRRRLVLGSDRAQHSAAGGPAWGPPLLNQVWRPQQCSPPHDAVAVKGASQLEAKGVENLSRNGVRLPKAEGQLRLGTRAGGQPRVVDDATAALLPRPSSHHGNARKLELPAPSTAVWWGRSCCLFCCCRRIGPFSSVSSQLCVAFLQL